MRRTQRGELELFPRGDRISEEAFQRGEVEPVVPFHTTIDPEMLDPTQVLLHLPNGQTVNTHFPVAVYDGGPWAYALDRSSGRLFDARSGEPLISGPGARNTAETSILGTFLASEHLYRLPDMSLAAAPTQSGIGRAWAVGQTTAVAVVESADGASNRFEVWSLGKEKPIAVIPLDAATASVPAVALAPDERFAAVVADSVWLIDVGAGARSLLGARGAFATASPRTGRARFSRDGTRLCVERLDYVAPRTVFRLDGSVAPSDAVDVDVGSCDPKTVPRTHGGWHVVDAGVFPLRDNAAVSRDGTLVAVIDARDAEGKVELAVRLMRSSDGSVIAELPFWNHECRYDYTPIAFEGDVLLVGDEQTSCGGRLDVRSARWIERSGSRDDAEERRRAAERAADERRLVDALGPPFTLANWSLDVCEVQAEGRCRVAFMPPPIESRSDDYGMVVGSVGNRLPWPGSARPLQVERTFEGHRAIPRPTAARSWGELGTRALSYERSSWFSIYRVPGDGRDGSLLANVVRAGDGAVAMLSGGAVDIRGEIPPGTLFCLDGRTLKPWATCSERYLVPHALEHAIAGREDYLLGPEE